MRVTVNPVLQVCMPQKRKACFFGALTWGVERHHHTQRHQCELLLRARNVHCKQRAVHHVRGRELLRRRGGAHAVPYAQRFQGRLQDAERLRVQPRVLGKPRGTECGMPAGASGHALRR